MLLKERGKLFKSKRLKEVLIKCQETTLNLVLCMATPMDPNLMWSSGEQCDAGLSSVRP